LSRADDAQDTLGTGVWSLSRRFHKRRDCFVFFDGPV